MIAILAKLNVAEGKEEEFEKIMLGLAQQVREKESGNHLYTLVKDDDGYMVMEIYEDQAALAAHGSSDHFRASGREMGWSNGRCARDQAVRSHRLI